jgi:hypothetical protein
MKKALLVYGNPNKEEDKCKFDEFINTNLRLISQIAKVSGYTSKIIPISSLDIKFEDYQESEDFLFDYVGHSEGVFLGNFHLKKIVYSIEKLKGKKIILLDACTDNFIKRHNPPKNTLIAGCFNVSYYSPLSTSFYDAIIARGKKLDSITQETFNEMKHNWVQVKGSLNNQNVR